MIPRSRLGRANVSDVGNIQRNDIVDQVKVLMACSKHPESSRTPDLRSHRASHFRDLPRASGCDSHTAGPTHGPSHLPGAVLDGKTTKGREELPFGSTW